MIQGTTSDAGKSFLVTAICRILARNGVSVTPFKPQNMALNSAVTETGGEIGRAQAVQAQAAKVVPHVDMNPVLLKPNSDIGAQVIVLGKAIGNQDAVNYHNYKPQMLQVVLDAHQRLTERFQAVVIEGAGSPAEINLRDRDIANMGFAEAADCKVIIVADIDKGGVFAHLVGTYELLSETERKRVIGFVINKFRGDISLLQSGIDWLEARLGIPVLATLPYIPNCYLEAEDAIDFQQNLVSDELNVTVIAYPRMSNHTDFDALRLHPKVKLSFARTPQEAPKTDVYILPGTKSVIRDLAYVRENNWDKTLAKHLRYGGKVLGVCGGLQMLGAHINDPFGVESNQTSAQGLGYFAYTTCLKTQKMVRKINGVIGAAIPISGYEIHAGETDFSAIKSPLIQLDDGTADGAESDDGLIRSTYLHGLFDGKAALQEWLSWMGITSNDSFDIDAFKEQEIERIADVVEQALSFDTLESLLK